MIIIRTHYMNSWFHRPQGCLNVLNKQIIILNKRSWIDNCSKKLHIDSKNIEQLYNWYAILLLKKDNKRLTDIIHEFSQLYLRFEILLQCVYHRRINDLISCLIKKSMLNITCQPFMELSIGCIQFGACVVWLWSLKQLKLLNWTIVFPIYLLEPVLKSETLSSGETNLC